MNQIVALSNVDGMHQERLGLFSNIYRIVSEHDTQVFDA